MTADEVIETYEELYPDRLKSDVAEGYAPSAVAYLQVLTAGRAQHAQGWQKQRALQAACAVINEMAAQDAARSEEGAYLAMVSNDGYTETYASRPADAGQAVRRAAMRWLSGTGLVSAL